jgi:hypothetical protein
MLPTTTGRVPNQTADRVNEAIRLRTRESIGRAAAGGVPAVDCRLAELDAEWDVERALEANAAAVAGTGAALALLADRRFAVLPLAVGVFLFQHAVQGWCPPLPVFRRLGFRTQTEIDEERAALKALRGDFRDVGGRTPGEMAADALAASRA